MEVLIVMEIMEVLITMERDRLWIDYIVYGGIDRNGDLYIMELLIIMEINGGIDHHRDRYFMKVLIIMEINGGTDHNCDRRFWIDCIVYRSIDNNADR